MPFRLLLYSLCPNRGKCSQRFHSAMPPRSDKGLYVNQAGLDRAGLMLMPINGVCSRGTKMEVCTPALTYSSIF
jgi:hypothetical protein